MFTTAPSKQDTGKIDLQGMVDYMAEFANGRTWSPVDYKQNGVGVTFPAAAPASYAPVTTSCSTCRRGRSRRRHLRDTEVAVKFGATTLGTFPLDNTPPSANPSFDDTGKASVDVVIPAGQLRWARRR